MKKLLISFVTIAALFCLSSCGGDKEEQTSSFTTTPPPETTTEPETTSADEETTEGGLALEESPEYDDVGWGDFEVVG